MNFGDIAVILKVCSVIAYILLRYICFCNYARSIFLWWVWLWIPSIAKHEELWYCRSLKRKTKERYLSLVPHRIEHILTEPWQMNVNLQRVSEEYSREDGVWVFGGEEPFCVTPVWALERKGTDHSARCVSISVALTGRSQQCLKNTLVKVGTRMTHGLKHCHKHGEQDYAFSQLLVKI